MDPLTIADRRERAVVAAADVALRPIGWLRRALRRPSSTAPQRILCLRLERIGDLVMTLPALAHLRRLAPRATIDLMVGSWNAPMAAMIADVDHVEPIDAGWLAREAGGRGMAQLVRDARHWKARRYDLAINFEPDVRSNILLALSGARRLAGFVSGGGGPLLDVAIPFDSRSHTADNAVRLVSAALGVQAAAPAVPALRIPDAARAEASRLLEWRGGGPLIAIHVSAGREVKQWPEARFHDVARALIERHGATIVFTGAAEDRAQIDLVTRDLAADRVRDLSGRADLPTLAAALERADLLVTVDTGPMHLAHAVGTPIVAVFGPSDPVRYAPRGRFDRVVRIDLPCAPCNRIRRPPERCVGHTPDCLSGIDVARVLAAVEDVLRTATASARESAG